VTVRSSYVRADSESPSALAAERTDATAAGSDSQLFVIGRNWAASFWNLVPGPVAALVAISVTVLLAGSTTSALVQVPSLRTLTVQAARSNRASFASVRDVASLALRQLELRPLI